MAVAARLINHCGEFPPMVVTSVRLGASPRRCASTVAGAGPIFDSTLTTETVWTRGRMPGTDSRARSAATVARSIADALVARSMDWPLAITTGTVDSSIGMVSRCSNVGYPAAKLSGSTVMKSPSPWAMRVVPWWASASIRSLRPSRECSLARISISTPRGVGAR